MKSRILTQGMHKAIASRAVIALCIAIFFMETHGRPYEIYDFHTRQCIKHLPVEADIALCIALCPNRRVISLSVYAFGGIRQTLWAGNGCWWFIT